MRGQNILYGSEHDCFYLLVVDSSTSVKYSLAFLSSDVHSTVRDLLWHMGNLKFHLTY